MNKTDLIENKTDKDIEREMELTFDLLQKNLKSGSAEPPPQVDAFIKAAAKTRAKRLQRNSSRRFILWFSSAAAVFAFSFSILWLNSLQTAAPGEASPVPMKTAGTQQTAAQTPVMTAAHTASDLDWTDVFSEMSDLSGELNSTENYVAAIADYDREFAIFSMTASE